MSGPPRAIERQQDHVYPLAEIKRLGFDLNQLLTNVINDTLRTMAGAERAQREITLSIKVLNEVKSRLWNWSARTRTLNRLGNGLMVVVTPCTGPRARIIGITDQTRLGVINVRYRVMSERSLCAIIFVGAHAAFLRLRSNPFGPRGGGFHGFDSLAETIR